LRRGWPALKRSLRAPRHSQPFPSNPPRPGPGLRGADTPPPAGVRTKGCSTRSPVLAAGHAQRAARACERECRE
jgi:hypothetical protein